MKPVRFVAVGDVMVDVVAEGSGHDARIGVFAGGSASNAASWAAALGAQATVVGRVGDDAGGRMVRRELEANGVHVELSIDSEARTGTFLFVDGEVRAERGANATFAPEHLPTLDADAVLVSGYLPRETIEAALAQAEARWIALDAAQLKELPPGGNVLLANQAAANTLGIDTEAPQARSYECVVVTRGSRGAVASSKGSVAQALPPKSFAGNPPGVGDAFAAGLLVSLAQGCETEEALANACRVAADAADRLRPT